MVTDTIPFKISEYVQVRFRYDFLCDTKTIHDAKGRTFYLLDIDQDEMTYHLKFDEKGHLVMEESEPVYQYDTHDGRSVKSGYRMDDY